MEDQLVFDGRLGTETVQGMSIIAVLRYIRNNSTTSLELNARTDEANIFHVLLEDELARFTFFNFVPATDNEEDTDTTINTGLALQRIVLDPEQTVELILDVVEHADILMLFGVLK